MNGRTWGVGAVVVAGVFWGCAPTEDFHEAVATTEEGLVICGNSACEAGESCASCPGDCGRCTQAHCGDGTCGRKESCATCAADCGACPGCGNGVCDASETCTSCSKDCGKCSVEFCGNGVCGRRESCTACARDCCPAPPPQCQNAGDCPSGGECSTAACTNGACGFTYAASGTPTATQTAGDCREHVCDGMGGITDVPDDMDLPPDDGLECTADVCAMGVPQYPPASQGTSCSGGACDGNGVCVQAECQNNADCPAPMNECQTAVCENGTCFSGYVADGTPTAQQTGGDCNTQVCDGMGGTRSYVEDTDKPMDLSECLIGSCTMGVPNYTPAPFGSACLAPFPALGYCDGSGSCI